MSELFPEAVTVVAHLFDVTPVLFPANTAQFLFEAADELAHISIHSLVTGHPRSALHARPAAHSRSAFHARPTVHPVHVRRRMDPSVKLICIELTIAILIHHLEEGAKNLMEGLLGIIRHFHAFGLVDIGRRHQHQHQGRAVAAVFAHDASVSLGCAGDGADQHQAGGE